MTSSLASRRAATWAGPATASQWAARAYAREAGSPTWRRKAGLPESQEQVGVILAGAGAGSLEEGDCALEGEVHHRLHPRCPEVGPSHGGVAARSEGVLGDLAGVNRARRPQRLQRLQRLGVEPSSPAGRDGLVHRFTQE